MRPCVACTLESTDATFSFTYFFVVQPPRDRAPAAITVATKVESLILGIGVPLPIAPANSILLANVAIFAATSGGKKAADNLSALRIAKARRRPPSRPAFRTEAPQGAL